VTVPIKPPRKSCASSIATTASTITANLVDIELNRLANRVLYYHESYVNVVRQVSIRFVP
jgi:hypothetical protein